MCYADSDKVTQQLFEGQGNWQLMNQNDVERIRQLGYETGQKEGRHEERLEIARRMLMHFSDDVISEMTSLSVEEVAKLRTDGEQRS